jgi:hypothetical protein
MKKIFFIPIAWTMLLGCGNNTNGYNKKNDTGNLHTVDTIKSDSSGMKIDNTENKKNEDSLPPMQH